MKLAPSFILVVAFLLSACSASGSTIYNGGSAGTSSKVNLTVHITKASNIVWGKVTGFQPGKTTPTVICRVALCHFSLKRGTILTFHQTPINATSWPFKNWFVNSKKVTQMTVRVVIKKPVNLKAIYVLQQ